MEDPATRYDLPCSVHARTKRLDDPAGGTLAASIHLVQVLLHLIRHSALFRPQPPHPVRRPPQPLQLTGVQQPLGERRLLRQYSSPAGSHGTGLPLPSPLPPLPDLPPVRCGIRDAAAG